MDLILLSEYNFHKKSLFGNSVKVFDHPVYDYVLWSHIKALIISSIDSMTKILYSISLYREAREKFVLGRLNKVNRSESVKQWTISMRVVLSWWLLLLEIFARVRTDQFEVFIISFHSINPWSFATVWSSEIGCVRRTVFPQICNIPITY